MTMLADNISLHLSGFDLLRNISLEVAAGAVTAIVRPNGAGTSSLLNVPTGEIAPTKGDVYLNQRELSHWPLLHRAKMLAVLPLPGQMAEVERSLVGNLRITRPHGLPVMTIVRNPFDRLYTSYSYPFGFG